MMLMRLDYPPILILFFAVIFESVSFDVIPTEYIYPLFLDFPNDSEFSPECKQIGYKSRYFILNSGSLSLYIVAGFLLHIVYAILAQILKKGNGKVYKWIKSKQDNFWYSGLISFYNETYLNLCFCGILNITRTDMDSGSTIGNNIFCLVISTAIAIGPIFYAIGVYKGWKLSERATTASVFQVVEGG